MDKTGFSFVAWIALTVMAAPVEAGGNLKANLAEVSRAIEAGDSAQLEVSLGEVLGHDTRAAAKGLGVRILDFPSGKEPLYWQVLGAVTSLRSAGAIDELAKFLLRNQKRPEAADLIYAWQGQHDPALLGLYERLLHKRDFSLRPLVCDRLGEFPDPAAVDLLLTTLEKDWGRGSELERRARSTLSALFGEDMGDLANYQGYWEQNRSTFFSRERQETGTVKDELDAVRLGGLSTQTAGRVLVIRGDIENFDHIEKVLEKLAVEHQVLAKKAFMADMDEALRGTRAVLLNCSFIGTLCTCPTCRPGVSETTRLPVCTGCNDHVRTTDRLDDAAIGRLQQFVLEGGSVFTEDYGLPELVEKAWGEFLKAGDNLSQQEVDYGPVPGQASSPLLRGVLVREGDLTSRVARQTGVWKVDNLSPRILVQNTARVRVLLASQKLKNEDDQVGAVAVSFSPGEAPSAPSVGVKRRRRQRARGTTVAPRPGIVLHVLSHFGKQGSQEDEFTLQNLLVNFLLEASERYRTHSRR